MTMIDINLYNEIYVNENPFNMFDEESPYVDYMYRLEETLGYRLGHEINLGKSKNWNMSKEEYISSTMFYQYASLLELLYNDELINSFYDIFPRYTEEALRGTKGTMFRNSDDMSIFDLVCASEDQDNLIKHVLYSNPEFRVD